MKGMKLDTRMLIAFIAIAATAGALAGYAAGAFIPKSGQQMIKDFYAVENAASVSPDDYVLSLSQGRPIGLAVDLRTASDYEAGHLVGAVNIPAGTMSAEQVVAAFRQLPKDRPIMTYCYSSDCMLSRNVGKTLSENGIFAKHMTSGWYEMNIEYPGYVVKGPAPGTFNATLGAPNTCSPVAGGEFGC